MSDPSAELSDEALCQRIAGGDEAAFDVLVGRYQQRAYRIAWSVVRDAEDARDLSQEAFIRLYQSAGSFGGRSRFSTWFYRILVNLCLDQRRKQRPWRQADAALEASDEPREAFVERLPAATRDPIEELGREQIMNRLWATVDTLAPQQRAALLLQVQEELATKEIAEVLRCSEATVRVHVHRALLALRKLMGRA